MDIKCRKTQCKFNENFVCRAEKINITPKCECDKFIMENKEEDDTTKKLLTKKIRYSQFRSCNNLNICCNANCLFNNKHNCEANGITVNVINEKPLCITFLKADE